MRISRAAVRHAFSSTATLGLGCHDEAVRGIVVRPPADEAELAADALWALGASAVEQRERGAGTVELLTWLGDDDRVLDTVANALRDRWPWETVALDPRVADAWREFAKPVVVDAGLIVAPAWRPPAAAEGYSVVLIEPGPLFGMGDHPSTLLCLRALRRLIPLTADARVLDVGCGSGVQAICALATGAVHARAIDIAPAAVEIVTANARRNGCEAQLQVDTTALAELEGSFDVVVANILAPTLIALAADLRRVLAPNGVLVVGGVLEEQVEAVADALRPLRAEHVTLLDGWAAIELRAAI